MSAPQDQQPLIEFHWGHDPDAEKFMHVEDLGDQVKVTLHPGLSRTQVMQAAGELGDHGPAIVTAWEQSTGYQA